VSTSAAPRWRRQPQTRRDDLLDAALRLFATKGLAATTVADIAGDAGVAKGSFFRYFATKDALLGALKARFFDQMTEHVAEVTAAIPNGEFFDVADAAIDATIRYLFDQADLVELWCRQSPPEGNDEFAQGMTALASLYEAGIAEQVAAGRIECDDPAATALLLVYAVEGAATHSILHNGEPDCDRIIHATQAMTRRVFHATGRRKRKTAQTRRR